MGLFDGMMGNVSEITEADAQKQFERVLAPGEKLEKAFILIRDMIAFTDRRIVLVDKQGITGKKAEYTSIPYSKITRFSVETAGTMDLDSELKIWVAGGEPIARQLSRKVDVFQLQATIASHL